MLTGDHKPADMLLEDCGDGSSRNEGRRVKIVVSLEDEAKWKEVRIVLNFAAFVNDTVYFVCIVHF